MKYKSCKFLEGGIAFNKEIVSTCTQRSNGFEFYFIHPSVRINWQTIENIRLRTIEKIRQGKIPSECKDCFMLEEKEWDSDNKIKFIEIDNWIHCNCGCIYCSNIHLTKGQFSEDIKPSSYYSVFPIIKDIIDKGMLSEECSIFFTGGEPTVLEEFPKIIDILLTQKYKELSILSSGIVYSDSIYNALKNGNTHLMMSIDSGSRELYKKIKRVDAFDLFIDNTKKYLKAIDENSASSLSLKYILIEGINDNVREIDKWIELSSSIGVKSVSLSVEFCNAFRYKPGEKIPSHYKKLFEHAQIKAHKLGLHYFVLDVVKDILNRGHY